jgi:CRISPR-associated protein Csm2
METEYNHRKSISKEWIESGFNNETVGWAQGFGKFLAKKENRNNANITREQEYRNALSTSKLRKFFGAFKRIQADPENKISELPMLKAYLAYDVGRDLNKKGVNESRIVDFHKELSAAIDCVETASEEKDKIKRFKNFAKIVESIVAYHKFYGGDN